MKYFLKKCYSYDNSVYISIGISLMYYIRQRKAEKEMDEIVSSLPSVNKEHSSLGARDLCLDLL